MHPTPSKSVFHLKYILTTHLSFLTFVPLPHVSHPQLYPTSFTQSFTLLASIGGPKGPSTTFSHKIVYFGKLPKFQGFFFVMGQLMLITNQKIKKNLEVLHLKFYKTNKVQGLEHTYSILFTWMTKHI